MAKKSRKSVDKMGPSGIRDRIIGFERVKASELVDNPDNWRVHPQGQRDAMSAILEEVGFAGAILTRRREDGRLEMIDGHLRRETLPEDELPVLITDLTPEEAMTLLAVYDPLASMAHANVDILTDLVNKAGVENEELLDLLRVTGAELDDLLDPNEEWVGMPEFDMEDMKPFKTLHVHFSCEKDYVAFAHLVKQPITMRSKWMWFPKR